MWCIWGNEVHNVDNIIQETIFYLFNLICMGNIDASFYDITYYLGTYKFINYTHFPYYLWLLKITKRDYYGRFVCHFQLVISIYCCDFHWLNTFLMVFFWGITWTKNMWPVLYHEFISMLKLCCKMLHTFWETPWCKVRYPYIYPLIGFHTRTVYLFLWLNRTTC